MINKEIIRIASNTSNVGLDNKYSHKISLKNRLCGDKITLELIVTKKKKRLNKFFPPSPLKKKRAGRAPREAAQFVSVCLLSSW